MRHRRHHNNNGYRQIKTGTTEKQLKRIAGKLGLKYGGYEMIIHGSERQDKEEENKKTGSFKTEVDKFFQENINQIADRFFLNYKAEWMEASALRAELRVILRKYLKMLSNTHNAEPTMNVDQAIEALDQQKQYRLRNVRVLKEIKNILVGKGYNVEYMDIEKLPEIIENGMPRKDF